MTDYEQLASDITQEVAIQVGDSYEEWDKSATRATNDYVFVYAISLSDDGKEFEISAVDSQQDGIFYDFRPLTSTADELKVALGEMLIDFSEYLQDIADVRNSDEEQEFDTDYEYDYN
jgi:hypothetical protein